MPRAKTYLLTAAIVAAFAGGPVVALDASAVGRSYPLHAVRPDASLNTRVYGLAVAPDGALTPLDALDAGPVLTRVDVVGPLEECAGYHDECGGWSDGHDAVAERIIAALAVGDVLIMWRCPGGAVAGCQAAIDRVLAAKDLYGRRITSFAGELMASAAAWWGLAISDEVWTNAAGIIGSLGARGAHASIAGALAAEGVEVTHFAWPDEGKVALAPELPLSDIGRERGNRDVTLAGEALAAGVLAGPVARRYGLTLERIKAMRADAYTGDAARAMGLCDGIASFEDVETYALAIAGGEAPMATTAAEDTPHEEPDGDEAPAQEGTQPSSACSACGMGNAENAKFCNQCGGSMAAKPLAEDEEPMPESARGPSKAAASPAAATRPNGTLAALAGLQDGASMPAIMTALARRNVAINALAKATGTTDPGAMVGGLEALTKDAGEVGRLRSERDAAQRKANAAERMTLLGQLEGRVHTRGELFVDIIEGGKVTGRKPAPLWSAGPQGRTLENLRGYVTAKLANAPATASRNPFEPDAKAAEGAAKGEPTSAQIEAAKKNPAVIAAASRPGAAPIDQLARAHVAAFGGSQ